MFSNVGRNLYCVTATGCSAVAASMASFVYFGLHTYVTIEKLTMPSLCEPDICEQIKKEAIQTLPGAITATAISALALYASITLTRQLKSHIIKMGSDQALAHKPSFGNLK